MYREHLHPRNIPAIRYLQVMHVCVCEYSFGKAACILSSRLHSSKQHTGSIGLDQYDQAPTMCKTAIFSTITYTQLEYATTNMQAN